MDFVEEDDVRRLLFQTDLDNLAALRDFQKYYKIPEIKVNLFIGRNYFLEVSCTTLVGYAKLVAFHFSHTRVFMLFACYNIINI